MHLRRARTGALAAAGLAAATAFVAPSAAAPAKPKPPVAFDAVPATVAQYGIRPPSADPARQRHVLTAGDGVEIFVETWLPAANGDAVPPERVPVVVSISPYLAMGAVES